MTRCIKTQILINTSDTSVWDVLTDIGAYDNWNPFIRKISGFLEPGSPIHLQIRLSKGINIQLRARINRIKPCWYLSWSGPTLPFTFGNEHFFEIRPAGPAKTLFIHGETFSGLVGFFMHAVVKIGFLGLYNNMNTALKHRAEENFKHFMFSQS